jgi:hypothetical protein
LRFIPWIGSILLSRLLFNYSKRVARADN